MSRMFGMGWRWFGVVWMLWICAGCRPEPSASPVSDTPKVHSADQKILDDIAKHGWSVMIVQDEKVSFGYTIGIHKTFGKPELFISGLSPADIQHFCNEYGKDIKAGKEYKHRDVVKDWFADSKQKMVLSNLHDGWKSSFLGKLMDLNPETNTPVLQAVWSDGNGLMPLMKGFDPKLEGKQFFLTEAPKD